MGKVRRFTLLALSLCLTSMAVPASPDSRPLAWARPLTCAGVSNFYQLDTGVYRSAQPSAAGMAALSKLGVKRVLNLRAFHSDSDEIAGGHCAMGGTHCGIAMWNIEEKTLVNALRTLSHPENGPVLIHCQRGADRTGLVCALYRIMVQNWSKEDAIHEYTHGGYGYAPIFQNMVRYLKTVDVPRFKAAMNESR